MEDLIRVAKDTLAVVEVGSYVSERGEVIPLDAAPAALATRLYRERDLDDLVRRLAAPARAARPLVEVTGERSAEAARRLATRATQQARNPGILNFANGVRPGGAFEDGARAQEEQLCRCSALYACLRPETSNQEARAYYLENDASGTALVLDHVLVSPGVVFFKDEDFRLLDEPFRATVLTCAAPDMNWLHATTDSGLEALKRYDEVPALFRRRARGILAAAADAGVDELVLGAWGCGAFRNDPVVVATAFHEALAELGGNFSRVVFAVWGGTVENRAAFERRFRDGVAIDGLG